VRKRLWLTLFASLFLAIVLVLGAAGAPPESIPRRDLRWDHYVTAWTAQGIFFLRFREHPIYLGGAVVIPGSFPRRCTHYVRIGPISGSESDRGLWKKRPITSAFS
jgi:hypothetical protein